MRIGVDLGGSKIEIIALAQGGAVVARRRTASPQNDYAATIRVVADLVGAIEAETQRRGTVGIGIPGSISPTTGIVRNANSVWLNGRPLDKDLAAALQRPVHLANDANCFALSEATDGAGAGHAVVFGVIIGTGCGGGIVVNGKLLDGRNAIAGEWGHNPLPWPDSTEWPGLRCWCGRLGCIETYVSGPGLAADHERHAGQRLEPAEIAAKAEASNAAAAAAMARFERRLAKALASVINVVDPGIIVLGGGCSNIERLYRDLPGLWRRHVFSDQVTTELARARHGDSSGVRGAAWLWP